MSQRPVVRRNLSILNNTPVSSFLENRPVKKSRGNKSAQVPENLRGNPSPSKMPPIPWRELHAATGKIPRHSDHQFRLHRPAQPHSHGTTGPEALQNRDPPPGVELHPSPVGESTAGRPVARPTGRGVVFGGNDELDDGETTDLPRHLYLLRSGT